MITHVKLFENKTSIPITTYDSIVTYEFLKCYYVVSKLEIIWKRSSKRQVKIHEYRILYLKIVWFSSPSLLFKQTSFYCFHWKIWYIFFLFGTIYLELWTRYRLFLLKRLISLVGQIAIKHLNTTKRAPSPRGPLPRPNRRTFAGSDDLLFCRMSASPVMLGTRDNRTRWQQRKKRHNG